jgi:hypothetical protein
VGGTRRDAGGTMRWDETRRGGGGGVVTWPRRREMIVAMREACGETAAALYPAEPCPPFAAQCKRGCLGG